MRSFATICLCWSSCLVSAAFADTGIRGIVYDDTGGIYPDAPVQMTNQATGAVSRTFGGADGNYAFQDLAPGRYAMSIAVPCCRLANFSEEDIELNSGERLVFDVHLPLLSDVAGLGDDPWALLKILRKRQTVPDLPVPKTSAGRPDLSGVWLFDGDPYPMEPEALEWAAKIAEQRVADDFRDLPATDCLPESPPQTGFMMGKFVHTDDLLVILFEEVPTVRQVFLDGRDHPADPDPSWTGHSIGRWEGDTLVVDTIGYNDRGWLPGAFPISEKLHIIEYYTRTDYGVMEQKVVFDDPEVFAAPWVRNQIFELAPQEELMEHVCENNKWSTAAGG